MRTLSGLWSLPHLRALLTALWLAPLAAWARQEATNDAFHSDPTQPVEKRVDEILTRMTLEEKVDYIGGARDGFSIRSVSRLGLPTIKMSDGPMGSRNDGPTTAYPGGIALAATWDADMARRIGIALGRDCRARGVNILLAPAVNIYRSPLCGRNFEYLGEDPYLASTMVVPLVQGIQSQQVLATVKHYACNNQEYDRNYVSSEVDERTLQEIYFPAFKAAVQQGKAGCVMTAYNLVNGVHCAESDYLLNQVLKGDWGFQGVVMSDWGAVHNATNSFNGGLDLEMPNARFMNRTVVLASIKAGQLQEVVLDDKVRRILREIIAAGFIDRPQALTNISRNDLDNAGTALAGAREAIVLLKNERHTLPLDRTKLKSILVTGPNAVAPVYSGGGSAFPRVFEFTSLLEGVRQAAGGTIKVVSSKELKEAVALAKESEAVVFCAGFDRTIEGEGRDRPFDLPLGQIDAIHQLAAVNRHVIVVISSGGGVSWKGWLDRVPAVVQAWYPGQAVGRAVAEILFGDVNPSGKLPATFEKKLEDNPTAPYYRIHANNKTFYTEGVFVGYRGYDQNKVEPQFCFGYGLSYTDFKYGKVQLSADRVALDGDLSVSMDIKNAGKRAGDEIVELYVHEINSTVKRPPKELKGFARLSLKPGETKTATIPLSASQLAYYDVSKHGWQVEPGIYEILIGSSSRDIRGKSRVTVGMPAQ